MDDAAQYVRRALRRKWLWCLGGCVLFPIVLSMSYIGSIGAICWGQSSGFVSTATTNKIPQFYYHPLSMYLTDGSPGSIYVMQFLHWCTWAGDHDEPWQVYWKQVRADYEEQLEEIRAAAQSETGRNLER